MTRRPSADPRRRSSAEDVPRRFVQGGTAVFIGCVVLLWLVVAAATTSTMAAIGAVVASGMAAFCLVLALGVRGGGSLPGALERFAAPVIVAGLFFAPMNDVRPTATATNVTLGDTLLAMGLLLLAPVLLTRKLTLPKAYVFGWILLASTSLVASALATNPAASFTHFVKFLAAALVLPVAFAWWRPDRRTVVRLATAYVIGTGVSIVSALIEGPIDTENRHDGLTTHPNFLGHTAVLALCLTFFVLTQHGVQRRWFFYGVGLLCVYGVWISGSRASFVGLVAVAVLYPLIERSMLAAAGTVLGLVMTLVFWEQIVSNSGDSALRRLLGTASSEASDQIRRNAFTAVLDDFLANPLTGVGFENVLYAHNIYVEIAAAAGVFGLFGFLLILWALVSPLFTAPRPYHRLAYPVLAYVIVDALDKSLYDRFVWTALSLAMLSVLVSDWDRPRGWSARLATTNAYRPEIPAHGDR